MSLCDRCTNPGQCCSGFTLNVGQAETYLEALVKMATIGNATDPTYEGGFGHSVGLPPNPPGHYENIWLGLPFLPLFKGKDGYWRYWCQYLGHDGRCTIYENRPPLCRTYEPACDALCAMHEEQNTEKSSSYPVAA